MTLNQARHAGRDAIHRSRTDTQHRVGIPALATTLSRFYWTAQGFSMSSAAWSAWSSSSVTVPPPLIGLPSVYDARSRRAG